MPLYETYASRVAATEKAGVPDVYTYDHLPEFLRDQIAQIFTDCIGPGWKGVIGNYFLSPDPPNANHSWRLITKTMNKEVQSFRYFPDKRGYAYDKCMNYIRRDSDLNGVLSLIETCGRVMYSFAITDARGGTRRADRGATADPGEGLAELNERFLHHSVGYQFENGQIIRVDSQYVHTEVVRDALRLLHEPGFEEAYDEFMTAHRHLREGKLRDCNTAALRATENVLNVICDARGWPRRPGDNFERLLAIVQTEGLFPNYLGGYFANLIGAMKAGGPKIRDRQGGHGAAPEDKPVPDHIGAFALHLTAANIVMLVKAYRALPS